MNIITEVGSTSENKNSLEAFRDCHCHIHVCGYGNTIVDEREKNRWLKSNIDHYYQDFSEQRQTEQKILKMVERKKRKDFARNEMNHAGGFLKLALLEFAFIGVVVLIGVYFARLLDPFMMDSIAIRLGVGFVTLVIGLFLTKKFLQVHMWGCERFGLNDWD